MDSLTQWLSSPDPEDMCWLRVEEPSAAAGARRAALAMAKRLGFADPRAELLALAATEAASNLAKHARQGTLLLRACHRDGAAGIELVTIDVGPGINDVTAVQRDGHSTTGTLGIGLGAIGRSADFCEMYSQPGRGTTLVARFLPGPAAQRAPGRPAPGWAGLVRPINGETMCGDAYAASRAGPMVTGMLCDGLGHGPLAAAASREAVAALREAPADDPVTVLERAHSRMRTTRGGALAVVRAGRESVHFAGIGNVAAWILTSDARRGMVSVPGIAGHQSRRVRQYEYPLAPGDVVILHSDGLSSRWSVRDLPGLTGKDSLVIAAALLSEAGVHRDDAGILVLKP